MQAAGLSSFPDSFSGRVECGGTGAMISLEDCITLCGLTEAEILAIAEHEHVPECAAALAGRYLLTQPHGLDRIASMIRDDIRAALGRGDARHAAELLGALRHLMATHPETEARLSRP